MSDLDDEQKGSWLKRQVLGAVLAAAIIGGFSGYVAVNVQTATLEQRVSALEDAQARNRSAQDTVTKLEERIKSLQSAVEDLGEKVSHLQASCDSRRFGGKP